MRSLLAQGVRARDIAIAAASTDQFDGHFGVLAAEAALPVCFTHGVPALGAREGQVCAALADLLAKGLSRDRVFRLFTRLPSSAFHEALPDK